MKKGSRTLKVINGGLSQNPGTVRNVNLSSLPATFIQLEPRKGWEGMGRPLAEMFGTVWCYGDKKIIDMLSNCLMTLHFQLPDELSMKECVLGDEAFFIESAKKEKMTKETIHGKRNL